MGKIPPINPNTLTKGKKWSFIETSKNLINNQKPDSEEAHNNKISQTDNLSECEPDVKDSIDQELRSPLGP